MRGLLGDGSAVSRGRQLPAQRLALPFVPDARRPPRRAVTRPCVDPDPAEGTTPRSPLAGALRVRSVGARAVLLEVDGLEQVWAWRQTVAALVAEGTVPPPRECVPGARTLLLDGVDPIIVRRALRSSRRPNTGSSDNQAATVEVPVVYDGVDLAEVARLWGMSERGLVARHTGTQFLVAFCGFAPGFPYLVGLDGEVPRRATPRPSVPAGSVGLAGRYCGIYPTSSPGGWQLIGTTSVSLFDAHRDPPALLPPHTRVRFVEASRPAVTIPARRAPASALPLGGRALTVVRPGALTTIQDVGRVGLAHLGVPRAGALDRTAAQFANRLVGNREDAAVLETTLSGVGLRAEEHVTVAVTGAAAPVTIDGVAAPWGVPLSLPHGSVLQVGSASHAVRSYVAVAGGITVPTVLGSRSSDTLSGLGPDPLTAGDVLPVGPAAGPPAPMESAVPAASAGPVVLRLSLGPRADWFGSLGLDALQDGPYRVSPLSNRIGARLTGKPVPRLVDTELDSEGLVLGAVQVPPDGQPVVLLADHPTTGGYPVIAVVDPRDLSALAQTRPGMTVRFVLTKEQ